MKVSCPKKTTHILKNCKGGDIVSFPQGFYGMGKKGGLFLVTHRAVSISCSNTIMREVVRLADGWIVSVNNNFFIHKGPSMNIINQRKKNSIKPLQCVEPGIPVQFDKIFNGNYPPNEIFVAMNLGSYKYYCNHITPPRAKLGVLSLTSGKVSFVDPDRMVVEMNAEVKVNGPAT